MNKRKCSLKMADGGVLAPVMTKHKAPRFGLRDGDAYLEGPGGPTDDEIDAKLSAGEAVLPADTVRALGPGTVQRIIDATHTPVRHKGMRNHFADGLVPWEPPAPNWTPGNNQLPTASASRALATIPPPVYEPVTSASRALTEAPYRPNWTYGAGPGAPGPAPALADATPKPSITNPTNTNVGANGSAEARAWQAGRAPAAPTPPATPRSYNIGLRAGQLVRGALPGAVGAEVISNFGDHKISPDIDPVDSSAAGTFNYLKQGDWSNVGNSLRKGLVETGMDVASGLASFGDYFLPGQPLQTAVDNKFKNDLGSALVPKAPKLDNSVLPGTHDLPSVSDGPNATDQRLAAGLQVPNGQDASYVRFGNQQGKTVAGLDDNDVRKFKTADGRTIYSNVRGDNAQMMSPAGAISEQNSRAADALSARYGSQARSGLRAGMPDEPNLPAGYGATIPANAAEYARLDLRDPGNLAARNAEHMSVLTPPKVSFRETARLANQKEIASDQNATTRRGQDINADVTREGHKVNMRGQDITAATAVRGQDSTARTAAMQARVEQFNKDRSFELDKARYGTEVAEKNRAASIANDEAMRKDLETRFRTTDAKGNDVPDHGKIAAFSTATNSTIPRMIEALEAKGTPEAVAKAKALRERGSAALEKGDIDGLHQLFDRRERMRDARGLGPNKGTFSESDNLLDYKQTGVEHRTFGGNRVVTPAGSVSINDLRYTEPANSFLPDFFKIENRNLTRGVRSE